MIKEKVKDLMHEIDFPDCEQKELLDAFDVIVRKSNFIDVVNSYESNDFDFQKSLDEVKQIAEENLISSYTAHMLLLLCMSLFLQNKYKQKGISNSIFYDTMRDLSYKLEECRLVHGKCGTFVASWYKGFFEMRIFALGRLQFEINHTWFDCVVKGKRIPKGTKVLSVHIPRSGMPLQHDLVLEAYNKAKEFFKDEFKEEIIFICNSWLLYPWNRTVYKNDSNLAQFYDDFTIVASGNYQNYSESWRLFDCIYDGNPNNLPGNTSLRRAFIERIKNAEPIGHGTGVIIFNK